MITETRQIAFNSNHEDSLKVTFKGLLIEEGWSKAGDAIYTSND